MLRLCPDSALCCAEDCVKGWDQLQGVTPRVTNFVTDWHALPVQGPCHERDPPNPQPSLRGLSRWLLAPSLW